MIDPATLSDTDVGRTVYFVRNYDPTQPGGSGPLDRWSANYLFVGLNVCLPEECSWEPHGQD